MNIKTVILILFYLLLSQCYTVIDKEKLSNTEEMKPIIDSTVFLPPPDFIIGEIPIINLFKEWVDSRERKDVLVWRPIDYKEFPLTRFREKIVFHENGVYEILRLAPDDRHYFEKFRWRLSKDNSKIIVYFEANGNRRSSALIDTFDEVTLIFKKPRK